MASVKKMVCPTCGTNFDMLQSRHKSMVKKGQKSFYCSNFCALKGKVRTAMKGFRLTNRQLFR